MGMPISGGDSNPWFRWILNLSANWHLKRARCTLVIDRRFRHLRYFPKPPRRLRERKRTE